MAPKTPKRKAVPKAPKKSLQRAYRFDRELYERFEEDCSRYLSNPKLVTEALIIFWLEDADPEMRAAIAKRHIERFGPSQGYRRSD